MNINNCAAESENKTNVIGLSCLSKSIKYSSGLSGLVRGVIVKNGPHNEYKKTNEK